MLRRSLRDLQGASKVLLGMMAAAVSVGAVGLGLSYRTSIDFHRKALAEAVRTQVGLIEAAAREDPIPQIPPEATPLRVEELRSAAGYFADFGLSGELLIAKQDRSEVVYLLKQRRGESVAVPSSMSVSSRFVEPMRRALTGESGTMVTTDYMGNSVLAAYRPIEDLGLGVVAKIDLAEIRRPFLAVGLLSALAAALLTAVGTFFSLRSRSSQVSDLRRREEAFRTVFECAHDGQLLVSDVVLECNHECSRIWGGARSELVGRSLADLMTPENGLSMLEVMAALPSEPESAHTRFSALGVRLDESSVGLDVVMTPLTIHGEEIVLVTVRLGPEQPPDREVLPDGEMLFRVLARTVPVGIFRTDLDGRFLYVNEQYRKISGLSQQEACRGDWIEALHPADRDRVLANWRTSISEGRAFKEEFRFLRPDQEASWILCKASPETEVAPIHGFVGSITDITEQKEAEELLRSEQGILAERVAERTAELSAANAKLARISGAKDEFLASMSHELRTPISAILNFSETLLEEIYGPLNDRQKQSISMLVQSAKHLLSLINDILDISKIEAGRVELDLSFVAIEDVCTASLAMIQEEATRRRLSIVTKYDSRAVAIAADPRRLKEILVNLLSNAVKFTPDGGEIGLEVNLDADDPGILTFSIWDSGVGISPADMSRLFTSFVQLESGQDRSPEGSGLGLVLASRLVELHGGSINVESSPGVGSRFTVSLPNHRRLSGQVLTKESDWCLPRPVFTQHRIGHSGRPPRVLLADDNEASVLSQYDYLEGCGYQVDLARNGREAVAVAREKPPEIVLMDIQMPEMDGLEAIRCLRRDSRLREVPIIALTALAMPGDRERCLAAGADTYLSKPLRLRALAETIEELLQHAAPSVH